MRFNRFVPYVALLAVFVMAVQPSMDTDSWWHLRSGEWILENKQILTTDPFSLTRQGQPWIYPGWLAQVLLFSIYNHFGFAGMNLFTGIMVLIAFWFLWVTLEGRNLLKAFILLLAAAASGLYWSARPQILTFLLTSACLYLLERNKRGKKKCIWIIPFLMMLWVNIHGGFILGFILIGIYILAEGIEASLPAFLNRSSLKAEFQRRKEILSVLIAVFITSLFAGMINPHGPVILLYLFRTISIGALQDYIVEWQPPNFHSLEVQPYILLLLLTIFALGISSRKRSARELLLIMVFGYMSLTAARNVSLFALVAAPSLSRHLEDGLHSLFESLKSKKELPQKFANVMNLVLAILITMAALLRITTQLDEEVNLKEVKSQIPLEAFDYIKDHKPQGPLFHSYNWGGFVLWDLYPEYLSFVDGRTDLFRDDILDGYLQTWLAEPGWEVFLDRWGIQCTLLEINSPLVRALSNKGWETLYQSDLAIIQKRIESE